MDFKELLLIAEEKQKKSEKQAQSGRFISTSLSVPKRDTKKDTDAKPKSEILQRLLEEKEHEKQRRKKEEERERRKIEHERQKQVEEKRHLEKVRALEEKKRNTFRIPKKTASETNSAHGSLTSGSASEVKDISEESSFSSISSDSYKSGSSEKNFEQNSRSSSAEHHRHSEKTSINQSKSNHSDSKSNNHKSHNENDSKRRSDGQKLINHSHSSSRSQAHKSGSDEHRKHHSSHHSHSEKHKSGSDEYRKYHSSDHSHSEKHKSGSDEHRKHHSSDHSQSEKHKSGSDEHRIHHSSKHSSSDHHKSNHKTVSKHSSHSSSGNSEKSKNNHGCKDSSLESSTKEKHPHLDANSGKPEGSENCTEMPIALTRHHLKPTIQRQGGSQSEREKILAKLQAIREKLNSSDDSKSLRKRALKGDRKNRKAHRNKADLEGLAPDFSGSCLEPINYDLEEKPSLKRPEPKPEPEEKPTIKVTKSKHEKTEKRAHKSTERHSRKKLNSCRHDSVQFQRPSPEPEKPKIKCKPRPLPPPVSFTDLLKIAEQKQQEPVMVEIAPKKEKEKRPMTQEEIDRKKARQERVKTQEYKDWFKFGEKAEQNKVQEKPDNKEIAIKSQNSLQSNLQQKERKVTFSQSKHLVSDLRKSQDIPNPKEEKVDKPVNPVKLEGKQLFAKELNSSQQTKRPLDKTVLPTRPGMIANKPRAMIQHINNGQNPSRNEKSALDKKYNEINENVLVCGPVAGSKNRKRSASQDEENGSSPECQPSRISDKGKGRNAWDSLFSRPEYQKSKKLPIAKKKKNVLDSDDDEEYDDDMADFIDDEGEEDLDQVSSVIRNMFGYDKRKYQHIDDDDSDMEASFTDVMKEEARSAKIGRMEDLEDMRREEEELKRKAMKKKMNRKR